MDIKKLQFHYFIGLLLIMLALTLALFWPFLAALAVAFMAAIIVRPVHRKFLKWFRGRKTLAALAGVLFVLVVILVPVTFIVEQVTVESVSFFQSMQQGGSDGGATVDQVVSYVVKPIQDIVPSYNPDVQGYVASLSQSIVGNARGIFSSTASFALSTLIALFALFYLLRDGHRFKRAIVELSPLADAYDEQIIDKIERAVNSVVRGSLFISLVRGALTAVGFAFFGVPHPILWGAVTAIVSLLPNIGMFITLIPAILYLLAVGSVPGAIGLAIWSIVILGTVDNLIMPYVMGRGFHVHPMFVLLSVLGGLLFFGPIGLLLGPLVIAFVSALLEIYKVIVIGEHDRGSALR